MGKSIIFGILLLVGLEICYTQNILQESKKSLNNENKRSSPSPTPVPLTLSGHQWLSQNGSLNSRYNISGDNPFIVEIDIENPQAIESSDDSTFDAVMVGVYKNYYNGRCWGMLWKMSTFQLVGSRSWSNLPDYFSVHETVKTLFPVLNMTQRNTFKFAYDGSTYQLFQGGTLIASKNVPDGDATGCEPARAPFMIGAGVDENNNIKYWTNGKYYSMKFYKKTPLPNSGYSLLGYFDFTSSLSVNNRTEFPNLVAGSTDVLYLNTITK